jgi:8-oxo-dGTP pyrophosphatase MutT (NUDIX family)
MDHKFRRFRKWLERMMPHLVAGWHLRKEIHDDHRNGAFGVLRRKSDGHILVGDALYGSKLGTLPGGGIDHNETALGAFMRELVEEFSIAHNSSEFEPWGVFAQKARRTDRTGNPIDETLVDGLLTAFTGELKLEKPYNTLNPEIANQRFEPLWKIFLEGNTRYGISCLRLLAHFNNWQKDGKFRANSAMRDPVTTVIDVPSIGPKSFTF